MDAVCRMQTCCLINNVLFQREPRYLAERLCSRAEIVCRNTRQSDQLHFNKVRLGLEIGRRGFSHFGPKLYNGLPCDLKLLKATTVRPGFDHVHLSTKRDCPRLLSRQETPEELDLETSLIEIDVTQELENQMEIINTLNEDLRQAQEEIQKLKNHSVQLESLVLQKEEIIINLERKIKEQNLIIKEPHLPSLPTRDREQLHQKNIYLPKVGELASHVERDEQRTDSKR
ncbi:hypothetical protein J6590_091661, partial [Homalodisca vitripennis]